MSQALAFVRRQWPTLLLLIGSLLVVRWIVATQRAPGSMTLIEAQSMDMTRMKPPPGVQPVAVEEAAYRNVGGKQSFPGTVSAYSDENVVARIPGRVAAMPVYPGDSVRKGQLLIRLEADEYASQQAQAGLTASAGLAMATAFEREVERLRAAKTRAAADASAMQAAEARAEAEHTTALAHIEHVREEAAAKEAAIAEREADLRYAEQSLQRERRLHKAGASSLDELQAAEATHKSAASRLDAANAEARAAKNGIHLAQTEAAAAAQGAKEARARTVSARQAVAEADRSVAKAQADVRAKRAEARASGAGAGTARVIAGYRQLRALDDAVVAERMVSPGSLVMPGDTVLKLKVIKKVRVQTQLPERLAAQVRPGSTLEIRSGKLARVATVTSVFPALDPATRTFTAEALVENDGRALLPGMFVQVQVTTATARRALAVRNSAVRSDAEGRKYVWVMSESQAGTKQAADWTCPMHPEVGRSGPGACPKCNMKLVPRARTGKFVAKRRSIVAGPSDGTYTAVLNGVAEGEEVIWAGHESLTEGMPVEPSEWGKSGPKALPSASGMTTHEHGGMKMEGDSKPRAKEAPKHPQGATLWTCPMHPEVRQDKPGICPKCKMDLEPMRRQGR